jgi:hypothetical protein
VLAAAADAQRQEQSAPSLVRKLTQLAVQGGHKPATRQSQLPPKVRTLIVAPRTPPQLLLASLRAMPRSPVRHSGAATVSALVRSSRDAQAVLVLALLAQCACYPGTRAYNHCTRKI